MIQDIYPHKLNNQYHPDQNQMLTALFLYFTGRSSSSFIKERRLRRNGAGKSIFSG